MIYKIFFFLIAYCLSSLGRANFHKYLLHSHESQDRLGTMKKQEWTSHNLGGK